MCKKQQDLQLYKISTRVFVFYIIPPGVYKTKTPLSQNHLETAGNCF